MDSSSYFHKVFCKKLIRCIRLGKVIRRRYDRWLIPVDDGNLIARANRCFVNPVGFSLAVDVNFRCPGGRRAACSLPNIVKLTKGELVTLRRIEVEDTRFVLRI